MISFWTWQVDNTLIRDIKDTYAEIASVREKDSM